MKRMQDVLLGVDRNGTKTWGNCTCQRCGGAGGAEAWRFTGYTCYECGGTGISRMHTWKEYTPEYQAKLDARRAKREEKRRQERVAELKANLPKEYAKRGFGADGKAYAVYGQNTYEIKDELKAKGARWLAEFGAWVFPEKPEGYQTVELDFTEGWEINETYGTIYWKDEVDGRDLVKAKVKAAQPGTESEWLGEEGKKLETEATFKIGFEFTSTFGYREITQLTAIFEDEAGNKLVWKTGTAFERTDGDFCFKVNGEYERFSRGEKVRISGTVKRHSEFRGEKQTELTRAKVTKA